jgi:hypothetical protein
MDMDHLLTRDCPDWCDGEAWHDPDDDPREHGAVIGSLQAVSGELTVLVVQHPDQKPGVELLAGRSDQTVRVPLNEDEVRRTSALLALAARVLRSA